MYHTTRVPSMQGTLLYIACLCVSLVACIRINEALPQKVTVKENCVPGALGFVNSFHEETFHTLYNN